MIDGRHRLVTDEPERVGGGGSGPAPHELFPAALAACVSTTLVKYGRTKGWELGQVSAPASRLAALSVGRDAESAGSSQEGGRTTENLAQTKSPFRAVSSRRSSIRRGSSGAPAPSVTGAT